MTRRLLERAAPIAFIALLAICVTAGAPAQAAVGDVNGDGAINLVDALAVCRQLSGEGGPVADPAAADVDDDGDVDEMDVRLLMLAALGEPLPTLTFSIDPTQLDFLNVLVGTDADQVVTVTSDGTLPLDVTGVAFGPGTSTDFSLVLPPMLPVTLGPGGMQPFTVRYTPDGAGDDMGSLDIMTNAGDVSIPLLGVGISPELDVTPPNIDFGDIDVGTPVEMMLTISNTGTAPLNILSVAPAPATSPDFSVGAPGATLVAPGDSTMVTVGYTPAESGEDTGQIDVLTDGGNANVGLFGRGVAPELALQPDTLDFGSVLVGDAPMLSFDIRNTGNAPMQVTSVALQMGSSASLSLGAFPATPFTVLPGDAQAIPAIFTPTDAGPANGTVDVATDAGNGMVSLSGAGVRPEILLTPSTADFGNVMLGDMPSIDIEIRNVGSAPLDINGVALTGATSADFSLMAPPATPLTLNPTETTMVTIVYAPGEVGPDTGDLEVQSNDPDTPLATVPVQGNGVLTEFVLQPASLNFSNVLAGDSSDLMFEILNSGTTDLDVVTVELRIGSDPSFSIPTPPSLPVTLSTGQNLMVTVRFGPTATGPFMGIVDVSTGAGDGEVPLSGTGTAPDIRVMPTSLDFGALPASGSSTMAFDIHNDGGATLNVSSIAPGPGSDPAFSLTMAPALPLMIPAGGSQNVSVDFMPPTPGNFSGSIRILSDDPDQATLDVPLSGDATGGAFLTASPISIDFGDVPVGINAMADVTLTNEGDVGLTITGVAIGAGSSTDFTNGMPGATALGPGDMTTVQVTYMPDAAGADMGALEISTSANFLSVPLAGNGTVDVSPIGLTVNLTDATLAVDDCLQVRATIEFSDMSTTSTTTGVSWSSSDPGVAGVDAAGLVIAAGQGMTTVTATLGVLTATTTVDVVAAGSVRLLVPCGEVAPGANFTAELQADAGALPLGAYGIRLLFDPALLVITSIDGAPAGSFSGTPFFNAAGFTAGDTLIAAYQAASLSTPTGIVSLAQVEFQVTGAAGATGSVDVQIVELISTDLSAVPGTTTPSRIAVQP